MRLYINLRIQVLVDVELLALVGQFETMGYMVVLQHRTIGKKRRRGRGRRGRGRGRERAGVRRAGVE